MTPTLDRGAFRLQGEQAVRFLAVIGDAEKGFFRQRRPFVEKQPRRLQPFGGVLLRRSAGDTGFRRARDVRAMVELRQSALPQRSGSRRCRAFLYDAALLQVCPREE